MVLFFSLSLIACALFPLSFFFWFCSRMESRWNNDVRTHNTCVFLEDVLAHLPGCIHDTSSVFMKTYDAQWAVIFQHDPLAHHKYSWVCIISARDASWVLLMHRAPRGPLMSIDCPLMFLNCPLIFLRFAHVPWSKVSLGYLRNWRLASWLTGWLNKTEIGLIKPRFY